MPIFVERKECAKDFKQKIQEDNGITIFKTFKAKATKDIHNVVQDYAKYSKHS